MITRAMLWKFFSNSIWLFLFCCTSQCMLRHSAHGKTLRSSSANRKCGIQLFEDRIVGGNATTINDYPWAALLRYHHAQKQLDSWGCGGAYIGGRTILTAAHCVDEMIRRDFGDLMFVRLGEYDTETDPDCIIIEDERDCADKPIDFQISSVIIHPKRTDSSKEYDIALIILETKPPYTDFIRPICLPEIAEKDLNNPEEFLYVTGWGWTLGFIRSPSNVKQHVRVEPIYYDVCKKQYEKITLNPNSQICAGGKGGLNPCRGDSGGPLMRLVRGTYWELIGLVSFGPSVCAIDGVDGKAAVFTKVQYFIPWIVQNAL